MAGEAPCGVGKVVPATVTGEEECYFYTSNVILYAHLCFLRPILSLSSNEEHVLVNLSRRTAVVAKQLPPAGLASLN